MAETSDTGLIPRTYFRAPRVPFDFRALGLAIVAYLVYWGGGLLLKEMFGGKDVAGAFLASAFSIFRDIPYLNRPIADVLHSVFGVNVFAFQLGDFTFWHVLVGGIWFFAVWSFFGQGIHRIASLRIARDEGLTFAEALRFSWKNWPTVLLAPAFIAGAIGFFYLCNFVAGLVVAIPFVGGILGIILVPLAALSSLLILLIGLGGFFGLPLIGAAAAWERNGSLDAISRAFSYLFARPLQYFWNYFLILLFLGIVLLVGNWFVFTLVKSVDSGLWSDQASVMVDPEPRSNADDSGFQHYSSDAKQLHADLEAATGYTPGSTAAPEVQPFAMNIKTLGKAPAAHWVTALVFFVVLNLIWFGVFGYAVYWFLGASTSVYADLRADVDGTEEDEIYLEEEDEDFEALAQGGPTVPAPEPGAPPSTPPPPPPSTPPA
jgi:hypothetical protein